MTISLSYRFSHFYSVFIQTSFGARVCRYGPMSTTYMQISVFAHPTTAVKMTAYQPGLCNTRLYFFSQSLMNLQGMGEFVCVLFAAPLMRCTLCTGSTVTARTGDTVVGTISSCNSTIFHPNHFHLPWDSVKIGFLVCLDSFIPFIQLRYLQ